MCPGGSTQLSGPKYVKFGPHISQNPYLWRPAQYKAPNRIYQLLTEHPRHKFRFDINSFELCLGYHDARGEALTIFTMIEWIASTEVQ